jgi:dihydroorotate dehydrogenase
MGLVWEKIIRPAAFRLDAEHAHEAALKSLRFALSTKKAKQFARKVFNPGDWPAVERFGLKFPGPIGLAAGFDKNALAVEPLESLGFGFIEVGTVTLRPQAGNPKPRLFRLEEDLALLNRMGFNNDGSDAVASRLSKLRCKCPIGVNIGRNKDVANEDAVEDYVKVFEIVAPHADYVAINVSSPNTPGLRNLQEAGLLDRLLAALSSSNRELSAPKPIMVKLSPDLDEDQIHEIADVCLSNEVSGIIATNTTLSRSGLKTQGNLLYEEGGISGRPLGKLSNQVISTLYRHLGKRIAIIGVGGIMSAQDAFEKIASGASLLQVYTGFIYGGPSFPSSLSLGLREIIEKMGFSSLEEAVGLLIEDGRAGYRNLTMATRRL